MDIVILVVAITLFVVAEFLFRFVKIEWYRQQKIVNLLIIILALLAVFSEGKISYLTWAVFIIFTVLHLNDFKKRYK